MHHETNRDLLVPFRFGNFGDDMRRWIGTLGIFNWLCPDICSEDIFLDDDSEGSFSILFAPSRGPSYCSSGMGQRGCAQRPHAMVQVPQLGARETPTGPMSRYRLLKMLAVLKLFCSSDLKTGPSSSSSNSLGLKS